MLLPCEDYPDILYVFVNKLDPVATHNLMFTGCYISSLLTTLTIFPDFSKKYITGEYNVIDMINNKECTISPYCLTAINNDDIPWSVESDAEHARLTINPLLPSRLSATYAFGDYKSCEEASALYGWPLDQVVTFNIDKTNGLEAFTRVARVDMNLVSYAMSFYNNITSEIKTKLWRNYWNGQEGNITIPGEKPLWEYLIEGKIVACK